MMDAESRRRRELERELKTALDDKEEYLYEGEMSSYARTYAGDARTSLREMFRQQPPSREEIDYCVAEIIKPERLTSGGSAELLEWLGEQSYPFFEALARSSDAKVRLFAVETAEKGGGKFHRLSPVCHLIAQAPELLEDSDEEVRLAAARSSTWMKSNTYFLKSPREENENHIVFRIYRRFLALLDDASPAVRVAAAEALGLWASEIAHEALKARLEREENPEAREALTAAIAGKTGETV